MRQFFTVTESWLSLSITIFTSLSFTCMFSMMKTRCCDAWGENGSVIALLGKCDLCHAIIRHYCSTVHFHSDRKPSAFTNSSTVSFNYCISSFGRLERDATIQQHNKTVMNKTESLTFEIFRGVSLNFAFLSSLYRKYISHLFKIFIPSERTS